MLSTVSIANIHLCKHTVLDTRVYSEKISGQDQWPQSRPAKKQNNDLHQFGSLKNKTKKNFWSNFFGHYVLAILCVNNSKDNYLCLLFYICIYTYYIICSILKLTVLLHFWDMGSPLLWKNNTKVAVEKQC